MHLLSLLLPLALAAVGWAVAGPDAITGNITSVASPTMCKDNSGKWWIFSGGVGIEIRTSTNRTAWNFVGKVWPKGAPWTDKYTGTSNGHIWAPDCTYMNGKFYLYYAASTSGSRKSAIFLATSTTGDPGSWTDHGLITSTTCADNYNAIDPNLFIENGNWWLSLGSFWSGIKLMRLDPSTGKPTNSSLISLAKRTADKGAMEASVVYKFGSFYYLFTSWDHCCRGTSSTYNIRVGRASSVTGPYVDKNGTALTSGGGTLVLGTHDNIVGPGGQDLMTDKDGPILVYNYYTSSGTFLGINKLNFSSGWPVVV
ncbi:glycoside hydrolase family 43 protein [Amanita thiersii Skay4041]|uniref:arabinan endo-1,5-alpha-L-arabinosidase n=1 Tax=Amanita thiersii Skay4041 TaxID=703135 RepID=A0A2A9NH79_9AGAR|nr:glycoside hydrolase family 43 protein [Amanita thiersii Skay4041]